MSGYYTTLEELGSIAMAEQDKVEQVKACIGIRHGYFDVWIYGFLENKNFDVEETVSKLQRRFAMEMNEFATYELTEYKRQSMRSGVIQEIGKDKRGRTILYVKVKRDFPQARDRAERQQLFDMYVSYATRIRQDNQICQMILLVDQEGAGMFKNIDMHSSSEIALRISKYYPGAVAKIFICNMSGTLATISRPIIKRLPDIVSKRLEIVTGRDLQRGCLRDLIEDSVLPVCLGGRQELREPAVWHQFAERVEAYFAGLKHAVAERGLSVKEWELEQLGVGHLAPVATPSDETLRTGRASSMEEDRALLTCLSESFHKTDEDRFMSLLNLGESGGVPWSAIASELPPGVGLFFLDELLRWRSEIEDQERQARFAILREMNDLLSRLNLNAPHGFDTSDHGWYAGILSPLRALLKLFLQGVVLVNGVNFVCALIFLSFFVACLVVTVFLSFDEAPGYFYPLSCFLIMIIIQGVSLCTRGSDMIVAIYRNTVIPPFERLGSYWGTIAELCLFMMMLIMQAIVFCVYGSRKSMLVSFKCAFTAGWVAAAAIVVFTHIFFAVVGGTSPGKHRKGKNYIAALPFFLTLGIGENVMKTLDLEFVTRTSSIVICGAPLAISMLFGIAFLISHFIWLYVCTVVATMVATFIVNYYTDAIITSLSGTFMRVVLLLLSTTWLFVVFAFGIDNMTGSHTTSMLLALFLNCSFFLLSFLCLRCSGNVWLLRVSFILFLLYMFALWVTSFIFVDARMGVFCLLLIVHNLVNMTFSAQDLTNISGALFHSTLVLLLLLLCVMLGWYGTTVQYTHPQSLPSVPTNRASSSLTNFELYHRYPICTLKIGADTAPLGIIDISLLTELIAYRTKQDFENDFDNWFKDRGVTYDGVVQSFRVNKAFWGMHQYTISASNTTLLVLSNSNVRSSITSMVVWIDTVAMYPLLTVMPSHWAQTLEQVVFFVKGLLRFAWRDSIATLSDYLSQRKASSDTDLIVSGTGIAGGFVSIASTRSKVQSIVFAAPGLLHLLGKLGLNADDYHRYVLAVGADQSALDGIGGHDGTIRQVLACEGSAFECTTQPYISEVLLRSCGDPYGRQHAGI